MSGLEVIAAIVSIIELVNFSQKVLVRAVELRASRKDIGEAFRCINDLLPPISHAVERTKKRIESKEIDEETCVALLPIHRGIDSTLKELKAFLRKYTVNAGASNIEVFWKAGKSVFQEKKLKGIQQRLYEYVDVLTLSHAEAAHAGNFSSTEKHDILQNIAHLNTQAVSVARRCRNLLSLDGGGLRGLSILYILGDLMAKVNEHQDPPLKPCEVFDLIGGSGTGGLIAIMLGRLGMTVDECLGEYLDLFERLSNKYDEGTKAESGSSPMINSDILKATVSEVIKARGLLPSSKLRNDDNISCYTIVCATVESTNTIVNFQNYVLKGERDRRPVTIIDAACATLSSAKVFEAVEFGTPPSRYVAGDLGANNPIDRIWNEAQRIWGKNGGLEPLVSCVVSIGAGSPQLRRIQADGPGFTHAMYDIATQTEETAKSFLLRNSALTGRDRRYHRFNVSSLPGLGWEGYKDSGAIEALANNYLEGHTEGIEQCADHLQRDDVVPNDAQKKGKYHEVPNRLFSRLVSRFIGREETFSQMDDFFSTTDVTRPKVLILHALGGQGKSQIALEYCRRLRESHQGIFWINASSETTTTDAFEMIVNALELGNSNEKIKDVLNILGQWRTPWILVFDNYDAPGTFRNLKNFFPTVGRGKIIITSRNQGLDRFGSKLLEVPAMTSDEGLELLLREPVTLKTTNDEARRIVDRLGGLALAIDQAAAYIENKRMAIEDFIPTYEEARKKILDFIPEFGWEYSTMQVHGREEEAKALSAFATWEMSFEQLEPNDPQRHESAGHFLTLSAFVDHLNFAEDLFRTSWKAETLQPEWLTIFVKSTEDDSESDGSSEGDLSPNEDSRARSDSSDEQCRRLLGNTNTTQRGSRSHRQETRAKKTWSSEMFQDLRAKCLQLSLLRIQNDNDQSNRGSPVYSLHPLIRDWLQLRLKKNKRRDFCQEAISVVSVSIESFESQMTVADQKQVLLAHMNACLLNDKRFSKEGKTIGYSRGNIASRFGVMYRDQGDWSKAEELFKQVIEMKTRVLGPEHSDTLTSMGNLAWTFQDQGRWKEAEGLHERVMEAMKRVSGPEHPNTLIIMNNLAGTFRNQGRWKEAEGLHERVMETRKRVLGPEHPKTLNSMHNLALTFWNQGRWKEAEGLQIKVTEAMKRVSGPEHPYTLTSMNNLAGTFQNQGRWKEAEELFKQVIEIEKRVLGPEHPDTLNSMNNLAWTIRSQGRWKEAEGLQIKVMEAMKRVLGPEHPDTLASMNNLAATFQDQGRWKEAEGLQELVMEAMKRVSEPEHPHTLTSMNNLAWTFQSQGRWKEAEGLFKQVIETRKRVLGPKHPDTLNSMNNLAWTIRSQGRWKEAEGLQIKVMEAMKRVLGPEHPDTLASMNNLAATFQDQGRWKDAEKLEVQVMETRKKILGLEHPYTLTSMHNLALTFKSQGQWRMAEELFIQVVEIRKRVLGVEHPDTLASIKSLAVVLKHKEENKYPQVEKDANAT